MKTVKILHTADLHIDSYIMGMSAEKAVIRREERRQSFLDSIITAKEKGVDYFLIAGDLFDIECVSDLCLNFFKQCFSKAPGIKFFISPGNHDYLSENSVYNKIDFGENVHIFGHDAECIEIPEKKVRIFGRAFSDRFENNTLFKDFHAPKDDFINICVIHGMIGNESEYNPISVKDLEDSNMDYVALGHIHTNHEIMKAKSTTYAYSGIHDGRYMDEDGECGFIIGEIGKNYVNLSFESEAKRTIHNIDVDISDCLSNLDIINKLNLNPDDIYEITLCGTDNMFFEPALIYERILKMCFHAKIKNNTVIPKKTDKSLLFNEFVAAFEGKDDKIANLALKYGSAALEKRSVSDI